MLIRYLSRSAATVFVTIASLFLLGTTIFAGEANSTRYFHYGAELSRQEIQRRFDADEDLHCVQQITEETLKYDVANLFFCFNTYEEAQENVRQIAPAIEHYNLVRQSREAETRPANESLPRGCAHWALYQHTGYNTWMFDLCNGSQNNNHLGVWSLWKDGGPNNVAVFAAANFAGFSYSYASSQFGLVGLPFGGGGGRSSKVS